MARIGTIAGRDYDHEDEIRERIVELDREHAGAVMPRAAKDEWNELCEVIQHFEARQETILDLYHRGAVESGTDDYQPRRPGRTRRDPERPRHLVAAQDAGLRAISANAGALSPEAGDRLEAIVRNVDDADPVGQGARYLAAVGNAFYASAFGKIAMDPMHGHLRFSPEEVEAVREVGIVQRERAMNIGTGSAGGFAVPFSLDPTILLTSAGALNPIRGLARVFTTVTDQWKGVSSAGVTVTYAAEATEVGDNSPTLAQPVIDCAKWHGFAQFSIELSQDWSTLEAELRRLFADARDVNDAVQFLTGSGTDAPAGVLTGLTTAQRVQTAGAGAIAIGDVYALKGALPARFMPGGSFAMHPNRLDSVFRLTPSGSTTEPQAMPERDGPLVGKPVSEWTAMATAATTGTKWALYGSFRDGFYIADRLGITAEIVPLIMGATRRPTGERGMYVYGRTGSKVVVPEALRYGEVL